MQSQAKATNVRYGTLKLRQVADLVRGKGVDEAFAMLSLMRTSKRGAPIIENLLKSAVANFRNREAAAGIGTDKLRIKTIFVDGGPTLKRIRPHSQGRAFRILRQLSHVTVVVSD